MLIISKYKDYYDYLTGIYGVDPLKVLDRTSGFVFNEYNNPFYNRNKSNTSFNNPNVYFYIQFCGTVFLNIDVDSYNEIKKEETKYSFHKFFDNYTYLMHKNNYVWLRYTKNLKFETPISFYSNNFGKLRIYDIVNDVLKIDRYIPYPKLEDLNFSDIVSPHDAFVELSSYLSYKEPEINNKPEDLLRFESKGFDKKTSFRNK